MSPSVVRLDHPVGIVVTHDGFLFVADEGSGRIVRIAPEGKIEPYAGSVPGFAEGVGDQARLNGPSAIAIDRNGVLFVCDSRNYLIREIVASLTSPDSKERGSLVQPLDNAAPAAPHPAVPKLDASVLGEVRAFPWPLSPQEGWHEIAGVVGEARGSPGGIALDHLHSGVDIHGKAGEAALSVFDEKVSSPVANWDYDGSGEGIHIALFGYIHIRVGRDADGNIKMPEKFKPRTDGAGKLIGVRVRRGTRFRVGDFVGSLNRLNHVHLNFGPWHAQANPLALPFFGLKDTVAPTVESIEAVPSSSLNSPSTVAPAAARSRDKHPERVVISGDVAIIVTAYDRIDGNSANRKLGLFRVGYQLFKEHGSSTDGVEQALINIEFNRLPAEDSAVFKAYASGSGVSAYGTPTKFKYIVTNRVKDGEAIEGLLRTSELESGDYIIRVIAEDYAGNRASGPSTELAVTVRN
jgi:hypothetical protein